ncbi:hypothetical protein ABH940_005536 [Streptacidiphilus sp. BW17]|uniref:hypothetical protein n=1 Tax=Streptacidiphilus sp. BW17 TaxID=3156274 RepID=UPI0035192CDE
MVTTEAGEPVEQADVLDEQLRRQQLLAVSRQAAATSGGRPTRDLVGKAIREAGYPIRNADIAPILQTLREEISKQGHPRRLEARKSAQQQPSESEPPAHS